MRDPTQQEGIDKVKLFIFKNLVWVHYITVVVVVFLPPLNFFSFVYLNWLYVLIGVMIISPKVIYHSKWIQILTSILSIYSAIILLLRYVTQIGSNFISRYLKKTLLLTENGFGLSQTYNTYILLGNATLFLLFCFHRKAISSDKLPLILDKMD